jgi:hypothetical protein
MTLPGAFVLLASSMAPALDITALRSLTAVVDCGGFHRAAEALHIS